MVFGVENGETRNMFLLLPVLLSGIPEESSDLSKVQKHILQIIQRILQIQVFLSDTHL